MRARLLCCLLATALLAACSEMGTAPPDARDPLADAAPSDTGAPPDDASAPADATAPDTGPPADFEGFLDYEMRVGGIRGLAASVITNGRIARTVTRGMATDTAPVDEHTLFVAASISKTFVGAVILELAEEGRLNLDAPLDDVLGFRVRHPRFPDTPITARMLLTHTSSIVDDFGALAGYTVQNTDPTTTLRELVTAYVAAPAHFGATAPGTAYSYANVGFAVLGLVAEVAGGSDLRTLTRTRLFEPLALDGMGWFYADVDRSRLAVEYTFERNGSVYTAQPAYGYAYYPAVSLRVSIVGLSRWLLGHIQGGVLDGTRFLSAASIDAERRPAIPTIRASQDIVWYYSTVGGRRWLSHSGSSFGSSNQMLYDPATGRGIIVLTNSDAYIRSRFGLPQGSNAIEAIVARLDAEAAATM